MKNCAPVIQMNKREISNIYLGALLVICFQLTLIFLIISHMLSDKFKRVRPDSVLIILPRFLSSLMMHINVETDIRAGINLMKFAVNHPTKFKTAKKFDYKDDPTSIQIQRVYLAFFLGFCQATIAMVVEILVILYLTSQVLLTDVIMKFVALAAIVRFDDMYAVGLYDEKIKGAASKRLPTEYKRNMGFYNEEERDEHNAKVRDEITKKHEGQTKNLGASALCKLDFHVQNPRDGYKSIQFLRVIHKLLRIFYVSWNYYFTPFIALIVTFS